MQMSSATLFLSAGVFSAVAFAYLASQKESFAVRDSAIEPESQPASHPALQQTATFAAGCFWGVEAAFRQVPGVISTTVGYTGGHFANPTYKDVCSGKTGHAEAVEVVFDGDKVTYEQLLKVFWSIHDPTQVNRQGPDVGAQYRSAIFFHDEAQKAAAVASRDAFQASGKLHRKIATEITPASTFNRAEDYHQQYLEKRGMASCHKP